MKGILYTITPSRSKERLNKRGKKRENHAHLILEMSMIFPLVFWYGSSDTLVKQGVFYGGTVLNAYFAVMMPIVLTLTLQKVDSLRL